MFRVALLFVNNMLVLTLMVVILSVGVSRIYVYLIYLSIYCVCVYPICRLGFAFDGQGSLYLCLSIVACTCAIICFEMI